jgi:xanthine dehydrogenase accessory factor
MRTNSESIHQRIADLLKKRKSFVVATITETKGSTPQAAGAKMLIHPDGTFEFTIGGGTLEAEVIQDARSVFATGSTQNREYRLTKNEMGMYCQGVAKVMLEPYFPRPQLLILGGGHVGQALSRITAATQLFSVIVADDRKEYANRKKHPHADQVILTDRDYKKRIPELDPQTFVVIVTRCHATDKQIIKNLVGKSPAYIGLIGSKAKIRQFKQELVEEGLSIDFLNTIHAPIGIVIGGKEPAEVALSILAEIIQVKNQAEKSGTSFALRNAVIK